MSCNVDVDGNVFFLLCDTLTKFVLFLISTMERESDL